MVVQVLHDHWHAVRRDLLTLDFRESDIGVRLSVWELASIIVAAPPGTAVHHAYNEGWTRGDHLLANLGEQHSGLMHLKSRHPRPGVKFETQTKYKANESPYRGVKLEPMTPQQLLERHAKHTAAAKRKAKN